MVEYDAFRRELAKALTSSARRRRSHAGHPASAQDLIGADLCERLAADAENLDLHVYLLCELLFTHGGQAQRFFTIRDQLLAEIGPGCRPANATDIVRRALGRTLADRPRTSRGLHRPDAALEARPGSGWCAVANPRPAPGRRCAIPAGGDAVAAWVGIVAPVVSLWEFGRGASQWREQASADPRSAVPATLVSSEPVASMRHPPSAYDAVLSFRPAMSAAGCEASLRVAGASAPAAGTTLMVVPRSSHCEPPLLLSEIADPIATWSIAVALMIAGLCALKLRDRWSATRALSIFRAGWITQASAGRSSVSRAF